ncbi:MAG: tetratricopeptide repeat protein [Gammaproteobacteria bacterium]|nr:tetratricopeptide repeat protein [Gammaproteobacteria bacterium]
MRNDLPSGTVTLLLTDIEGSTRLLHGLGAEGYALAQAEHREVLRAAFRANNGVEVDTQGDAFFYAFPSTLDALRGTVTAQRGLERFDWSHGAAVKVRMGMHTGEPQRTDEGYVGVPVNTAARIAAIGHGGQVLMSSHTADLLSEALGDDEITLRDLGEHRLKDLASLQRLYQVVIPELDSDFAPLRTQQTRSNNLPMPPTPFVGRATEVAAVRDRLMEQSVRVLTLTGPGGMGKSRLALRVASELLFSFEDGAFFVSLAPVRHPRLVIPAIARALDIREGGGKTLLETLEDEMRDKHLLLVLDNFEHVRAAARDLANLMGQCPALKVLITSREALRLSGEREFAVPPLELPPPGARLQPEALTQFAAVRLFLDRAEVAREGFQLTTENAATVVDICRRLDGLPLALELAAARLHTMQAPELLEALAQRLSVLTDGAVDLPERQQTLRDAIAWSYELLAPEEQNLCRRLSVFVGGCDPEVAGTVCDPDSAEDVVALLDSLAAKSLLGLSFHTAQTGTDSVLPRVEGEAPRYGMLETIREYAREQLEDAGEWPALRARHRDWCLRLSEEAEPHLRDAESGQWLETLERDHDNLRAALGRCFESGSSDADQGLKMATSLMNFWYEHGYISEMRDWLERGLDVAKSAPEVTRARAFYGVAGMARQQGRLEEAEIFCEDALDLYRQAGDRQGEARALGELGAILAGQGHNDRSVASLEQALAILREIDDPERLSFTLATLGALQQIQGGVEDAAASYGEALDIARQRGDNHLAATALVNLGELAQLKGNNSEARTYYEESLAIYDELQTDIAIAYCLEVLAGMDAAEGEPRTAARLFGAAEHLREEIGRPVESFNKERYDHDLATARAALDDAGFDEARREGRDMSRAEAVALALRQPEAA